MPLIVISSGDIAEYNGTLVPAFARLYASADFLTFEGVFIAKGSPTTDSGFYQQFTASKVGVNIVIGQGDAYSTTDSPDNPNATYTLAVYDASGVKIKTVLTAFPLYPNGARTTNWAAIRLAATGALVKYAPRYMDNAALEARLGQISQTNTDRAGSTQLGVVKLDVPPATGNNPIAVGVNSPLLTAKQDLLISGRNIKTINSVSLLGEGNIVITGGGGAVGSGSFSLSDGNSTASGIFTFDDGRA